MEPSAMRIAMIGCGNMGGAMLAGWLKGGLPADNFTVFDPGAPQVPPGVRLETGAPAGEFDAVLVAIKPQGLADAAPAIEAIAGPDTTVLSILAGTDLTTLAAHFPRAGAVVRVMPNLAAALGKSPIALVANSLDQPRHAAIDALMAPLGQASWLEDEALMDAVTALAGSGPAFVYRFIDALAQGGAALGLPREQADAMALAMVEGAVALAAGSDVSPAALAAQVTSKGGTTAAGLAELDGEDRLQKLVFRTLRAAAERGAALREAAK